MILRNFISLRVCTAYMENSLRFEIFTEASFTSHELLWTQIMKLPYAEMKFYLVDDNEADFKSETKTLAKDCNISRSSFGSNSDKSVFGLKISIIAIPKQAICLKNQNLILKWKQLRVENKFKNLLDLLSAADFAKKTGLYS